MTSIRSPEFSPLSLSRKHRTSFSSVEDLQSNLESYDAQRKRRQRAVESDQQRKERLVIDHLRKRAARDSETGDEQQIRLADDRLRKRAARDGETEDEQQMRLTDDRLRKRAARDSETDDNQQMRLTDDRLRKRAARDSETDDDQQMRLTDDRLRKRAARDSETEDEQQMRLTDDRLRKRVFRDNETDDDQQMRLADDRLRKRTARGNETEDVQQMRLVDDRLRKRVSRENETESQRKKRLATQQQRSRGLRSTSRGQSMRTSIEIANTHRGHRTLEKERQVLPNQNVWPTAIPTQLKEYCLEDFTNQMSMPVLRQSICIICNMRSYTNTMKEYTLRNIPNFDKLSCEKELSNIISKAQKATQGKYRYRLIKTVRTILLQKTIMNMQTLSLCRTPSCTKKDTTQQQILVPSALSVIVP
jgi:hypothetical protein